MNGFLRQGDPATINLGRLVNPSDGITPYTTASLAPQLSKAGGAFGARHSAGAIAHQLDGFYSVPLDSTDTGTLGRLKIEAPGILGLYYGVEADYFVLPPPIYDALVGIVPSIAGVATDLPSMIVQSWRRMFRAVAKSKSTGDITTLADDGTTVLTTQPWTDDGAGNETLGAAH